LPRAHAVPLCAFLALGPACTFNPAGVAFGGDDSTGADGAPGSPDAGLAHADAATQQRPDAGPPPGVLACPSTGGQPPDLDGNLSDWAGIPALHFDMAQATQKLFVSGPYTNSATVTARCQSDAQRLYFAFDVVDDSVVTDSVELYSDDSVALYLDAAGDASGGYGLDDHEILFRPSTAPNVKDYGPNGAALQIEGDIQPGTNGYQIEIALPKDSLGVSGPVPKVLGFDLALNDDDNVGGQKSFAYGLWFQASSTCPTCCSAETSARPWCDTTLFGTLVQP
jgi:hypothetical protein